MTDDSEVSGDLGAVDWAATPLGPPAHWPQSLRTVDGKAVWCMRSAELIVGLCVRIHGRWDGFECEEVSRKWV